MKHLLISALLFALLTPPHGYGVDAESPVKLVKPLKFHDELVEVTAAGTLRRRYRVWGDYAAETAAWKAKAEQAARECNDGVRPLLVLRAPPELPVPGREIEYFR